VDKHAGTAATALCMMTCMLVLPAASRGAEQQDGRPDEELDETLIKGNLFAAKPQQSFDWLARLVGSYTIGGQVDLRAGGNPEDLRPVDGQGTCIGFGLGPAVHCELQIRWSEPAGEDIPGGVSTYDPAVMLFGFNGRTSGITYALVDSKGVAEGSSGTLISANTVRARRPCASLPGNCQREVHITAEPDLKVVRIRMDTEIDFRRVLSYQFVLNRVPGSPAVTFEGKR
jgi:hypothetical protein